MTQQTDRSPLVAVNLPELLARVDNDRDLVCELIRIFQDEFPSLLRVLQECVAREDVKRVETTSHGLRGMLSSLSATRAAALAGRLEQMGREEKTPGLAGALMLFEQEAANVQSELNAYLAEANS
jgi:HPt (histidine-containing phosphotransfer) domain-containing protein